MRFHKKSAIGGSGGHLFDSGCNLSGLRKVHVYCGPFEFDGTFYPSCILRVFLEFQDSTTTPEYIGFNHEPAAIQTFGVEEGDKISKIEVWHDKKCVTGLQIHTVSGRVSHLFGTPLKFHSKSMFQAEKVDGGNGKIMMDLVGIHGSFGGLIDSVGFTFANVMAEQQASAILPVSDASTQKSDEIDQYTSESDFINVTDGWKLE